MFRQSNTSLRASDPDWDGQMLDAADLANLLGISISTVLTKRSRNPDGLPPPCYRRPLRWRKEGVLQWLKAQEQMEQERIKEEMAPMGRSRG